MPTLQAANMQLLRDRDNGDLPWGYKLPDGREFALSDLASGAGNVQSALSTLPSAAPKTLTDSTTLKTGPGTQLRQQAGTNRYMVATDGYGATPKACTVTWAAGNVVTITVPSGHGCVEQDAFVTQAATLPGDAAWARVLRVASVVDANNITARLPFTPSAGPSGAITFQRCARNVAVDLNLDYNYDDNSTAGANPNRMASILAFVADSAGSVLGKNVYKYLGLVGGADNCQFKIASFPNSRSDTAKLYGPANNVTLSGYGQASEDCVSIQALEPAAFIGYMPCQGNVTNAKLLNWSARCGTLAGGAIVVYSDETYSITGTVIEKCEGWAFGGTADGLGLRPGTGFNPTSANLPDVTVRDCDFFAAGGDSVSIRTPMERAVFENTNIRAPGDTAKRGVYFNNNMGLVEFNACSWLIENWTPAAGNAFIRNVANAKTIRFNSCRISGKAGATVLRLILMDGASSQCGLIEFNNCVISDMDVLMRFESTMAAAPTVVINGGQITSVLTIANFRKTGGKLILNGPTITGASNGVCRSEGSGVVADVYGWANLTTPAQIAVGISGGKANIKMPFMAFDPAAANAASFNYLYGAGTGTQFMLSTATGPLAAGEPVRNRPLTFTAALTAATSGTLAANFPEASGNYWVTFSDGTNRLVTLANGLTTASWTGAVTATATAGYLSGV